MVGLILSTHYITPSTSQKSTEQLRSIVHAAWYSTSVSSGVPLYCYYDCTQMEYQPNGCFHGSMGSSLQFASKCDQDLSRGLFRCSTFCLWRTLHLHHQASSVQTMFQINRMAVLDWFDGIPAPSPFIDQSAWCLTGLMTQEFLQVSLSIAIDPSPS